MEKPINIYLRLINYNTSALTTTGSWDSNIVEVQNMLDVSNAQFISILSCDSSVQQTLNIGSQSTGAGAGKIVFNAFTITKYMDAISPVLFENSASGTPFKTAEVFFVDEANAIQFKQTYKLVAVKSVAWAASSGVTGVAETVSFEYGGLIITVVEQSSDGQLYTFQNGWNVVKNISDNDVSVVIL